MKKKAEAFPDLTVARVTAQEKGYYRLISAFGEKIGGMVIDTPGMRELGMWDAQAGIDQTFSDIEELSMERLQSYQKLMVENRYMEDAQSYLAEKKQKFKEISKIK